MQPSDYFGITIIGIGVWLLLRPVLIWYWKIDEVTKLLRSIDSKLGENEVESEQTSNTDWTCPNCEKTNPIEVVICAHCSTSR